MQRRSFFKTAAAASTLPLLAQKPAIPEGVSLDASVFRLQLKHTWTTVMSSSDYRDILHLEYTRAGVKGIGEGAPIVRYNENAVDGKKIIDSLSQEMLSRDPFAYRKYLRDIFAKIDGQYATKAAIDIAILDFVGRWHKLPLYLMLGLDPRDTPVTTYSIGVDTPEMTRQKTIEAAPYPVLKVKFGLGKDEATMEAIRGVTKKPIRADANEGYKTKEEALERIKFLEKHGVEFIEQPLPAHMIEETKWLRGKVNMPILADEACLHIEDIPKIAGVFDGIVIKLMKTGGVLEALRMIEEARRHKLKVLLGCMIESSVSITAAAHLTPLVDWADLDGNLLIANDQWLGVRVENGKLVLPDRPGIGVVSRIRRG